MKPAISVIIPVYNAGNYIKGTIESILNQTCDDFEVVCINDGSKDDTLDIISKMARTDSRIKVYSIENSGVSTARNIGIDKAEGKWIQFVDADDILEKNMMQTMLNLSEGQDLIVCSVTRENEKLAKREYQYVDNNNWAGKKVIGDKLLGMSDTEKDVLLNYVWNKLFDSEIIKTHCIKFNPRIRLGEDFVFVCEYVKYCENIAFTSEPLYYYYLRNGNSLVSQFDRNEAARRTIMKKSLLQLYESYGILNKGGYEKVLRLEGRYCWISISKFKSAKNISKQDCYDYISSFLTNDHKECMVLYCKENKSLKNALKLFAIKINSVKLLYTFLK